MKKELNSEINLVSFISLLSVCICFLIATAIWIQISSINVKQSVGPPSGESTEDKKVLLWAKILNEQGDLLLQVQRAHPSLEKKWRQVTIPGSEGGIDLAQMQSHVQALRSLVPGLKTALIIPRAESAYEDIIDLLDKFKSIGIYDLGISPI